jgi:hypothetical protein
MRSLVGRLIQAPNNAQAAIDAQTLAKLATKPQNAGNLARLAEVARRAANRAARGAKYEAQLLALETRLARLEAKRQAQLELDLRREARAKLLAQRDANRAARAARAKAKEQRWVTLAEKEEYRYNLSQRKIQIKSEKLERAERVKYRADLKHLMATQPWKLVAQQQDIVDNAYKRKNSLNLEVRGALAVMGADDPETIIEWKRVSKEAQSACNSHTYEKRKLKRLERLAREFDLDQTL